MAYARERVAPLSGLIARRAHPSFSDDALMRCDMNLTQSQVKELLDYDPETGVFTWRARPPERFSKMQTCRMWNSKFAGKRAGTTTGDSKGYRFRRIRIDWALYQEHHLAWLYMTGQAPPDQIDHIDRDATNNKFENLALSSNQQNMLNKSKYSNNASGHNGVHWSKSKKTWHAYGRVGGRQVHLGYFNDLEDASKAASEFRESNGFSSGHGKVQAHYR